MASVGLAPSAGSVAAMMTVKDLQRTNLSILLYHTLAANGMTCVRYFAPYAPLTPLAEPSPPASAPKERSRDSAALSACFTWSLMIQI